MRARTPLRCVCTATAHACAAVLHLPRAPHTRRNTRARPQVWDERLCALLDEAVEAGAGAAAIAEAVAEEARAAGARSDWQSPFAAAARKYGFSHSGGKLDDVTVVCVKVLDAAAPAIGGLAAAQTRSRL